MSDVRIFVLREPQYVERALQTIRETWRAPAIDGAPLAVEIKPYKPKRSDEQNRKLWAMLTDVSRQVEWYGKRLAPEDWKHMFSAALTKQRVVPAIDGSGFVVLGQSTSKMNKAEFAELIELIYSFGAERGVEWTEPEEALA